MCCLSAWAGKRTYLARLGNDDLLSGAVLSALLDVLDGVDDVHTLQDLSEDDVAAIEPASHNGGDELKRLISTSMTCKTWRHWLTN